MCSTNSVLSRPGPPHLVSRSRICLSSSPPLPGQGLRLFLGEACADENLLKPDDYSLSLSDLTITGGAQNDHVEQVITYEYAPFKGTHSILSLPRGMRPAPLKVNMR